MDVTVNLSYENYIFDLYGTIIDIHTEEGEWQLWKALAKHFRQYKAFYFTWEIRRAYNRLVEEALKKKEEIQVEQVFYQLFAQKGVKADEELISQTCRFFRDTSTKHLRLYEWSLPILQKLKENGKKIYLLSNAQRSFTYSEMEQLDIVKYFDGIYISSDYGVKKPNPQFFQCLLEQEGLDVNRSLFLGNDQVCDVLGAQKLGMDTWYVHTNCSPEYTKDIKATYEFIKDKTFA